MQDRFNNNNASTFPNIVEDTPVIVNKDSSDIYVPCTIDPKN